MKKYKKQFFAVSVAMFVIVPSFAEAILKAPDDLMYQNKPIDALCFNLEGGSNIIKLNNCGLQKAKYTVKGQDSDLLKKGYIGFDWKDTSDSYPAEGYSYYKFFPASSGQYWIYTVNNTGGSGEFTAIQLVRRRDAESFEVKTLMGGDRCNGGIQDVQMENNQLKFSVNLTAFDLFALANDNPNNLKAYDDLAACAVCCFGKAFYKVNANLSPELLFVKMNGNGSINDLSTQGKYQQCFNKLFTQYVNSGKTTLDETQLKEFSNQFNAKCFENKK